MSGWRLQLKVLKQIPFNLMLRENKHKYNFFITVQSFPLSTPNLVVPDPSGYSGYP
jgi:hypothetical protein